MNNPIGMCFPDFIGLQSPVQPSPSGQPCGKRQAIQDLCRLKAEKQILFSTNTKNADLPTCILIVTLI